MGNENRGFRVLEGRLGKKVWHDGESKMGRVVVTKTHSGGIACGGEFWRLWRWVLP
jgi:hypothetical protein